MATIAPARRQGCLFPGISNPLGNQTDRSQIAQMIPTILGVDMVNHSALPLLALKLSPHALKLVFTKPQFAE